MQIFWRTYVSHALLRIYIFSVVLAWVLKENYKTGLHLKLIKPFFAGFFFSAVMSLPTLVMLERFDTNVASFGSGLILSGQCLATILSFGVTRKSIWCIM